MGGVEARRIDWSKMSTESREKEKEMDKRNRTKILLYKYILL